MIDINDKFILYKNKKGKRGLIKVERIISINDADIYKKNPQKIPPIILEDLGCHDMIKYFQGRHCKIHYVCKSLLTMPQGCYDVLIEKITNEEVLINNHKEKCVIRLDRILVMTEW